MSTRSASGSARVLRGALVASLTLVISMLLVSTPASAYVRSFPAAGIRHGVASFNLKGVAAAKIRSARIGGSRGRQVSLRAVRSGARRGVLRLRVTRRVARKWSAGHRSGVRLVVVFGGTAADSRRTKKKAGSGTTSGGTTTGTTSGTGTTTTSPYFSTLAPGSSGLPLSDSYCADKVGTRSWEPRPDNYPANTTKPSGLVPWSQTQDQTYWTKWIVKRDKVTGNYTGTTDAIFSWAACKWGVDEDTLRAVAVQESDWHQSATGDNNHSWGVMQVRDSENGSPNGVHDAWGGYPDTRNETALNVDFYGAALRSCYDGDFYDGGPWLYGGKTVQLIAATKGWDYVFWGCVGTWYSGGWYDAGAQDYINLVKQWLAAKTWLGY
jgi:hypothetical protein